MYRYFFYSLVFQHLVPVVLDYLLVLYQRDYI